MKVILITTIFLSLNVFAHSQEIPIDPETGNYKYEEVVEIDGFSQGYLYLKALEWIALNYNSANDVIQLKDKESGKIIAKGIFKIKYFSRNPSINHTIMIYTKDGRYKYVVTSLSYSDNKGDSFQLEDFPRSWAGKKKLYKRVDFVIQELIENLKQYISKTDDDINW